MDYRQKISFEESLELPELTEEERQELEDIEQSEGYYGQALTVWERNRWINQSIKYLRPLKLT